MSNYTFSSVNYNGTFPKSGTQATSSKLYT